LHIFTKGNSIIANFWGKSSGYGEFVPRIFSKFFPVSCSFLSELTEKERKAPKSPGFFRRFAEFAFSPWYVLIKNVIFSKNVVEFVKVIDYNNTIL
jgi:hypothetical protein